MNTKEEKLLQIKKNCNVIKCITGVIMGILIAGLAALAIGVGVMCFKSDEINTLIINSDSANLTFHDADLGIFSWAVDMDKLMESGEYAQSIVVSLLVGVGALLMSIAVVYIIRKIFVELEQSETPFSPAILKKLRILFIVITVACFVTTGLGAGVIALLITRSVYCILDYGCVIQTEVDETL